MSEHSLVQEANSARLSSKELFKRRSIGVNRFVCFIISKCCLLVKLLGSAKVVFFSFLTVSALRDSNDFVSLRSN